MAITFGSVTTYQSAAWEAAPSTSHTIVVGQNLYLFAFIGQSDHDSSNKTCSGVTWNGDAMTELAQFGGNHGGRVNVWGLVNPDIGSYTLEASFNAAVKAAIQVVCMYGVDQTNPIRGTKEKTATATSISDTITSNVIDTVLACGLIFYPQTNTLTKNTGQTALDENLTSGYNTIQSLTYESGATSVTSGYSWTDSKTAHLALVSITGAPSGSGNPVAVSPFLSFFKNFEMPWKKKGGIWQPQNPGLATI